METCKWQMWLVSEPRLLRAWIEPAPQQAEKQPYFLFLPVAALFKQAVNWSANIAVADPLCFKDLFSSFL